MYCTVHTVYHYVVLKDNAWVRSKLQNFSICNTNELLTIDTDKGLSFTLCSQHWPQPCPLPRPLRHVQRTIRVSLPSWIIQGWHSIADLFTWPLRTPVSRYLLRYQEESTQLDHMETFNGVHTGLTPLALWVGVTCCLKKALQRPAHHRLYRISRQRRLSKAIRVLANVDGSVLPLLDLHSREPSWAC